MIETAVAAPLALDIHWDKDMIREITLRWADGREGGPVATPHVVSETGRAVQEALSRYVTGEDVRWPRLPLDFSRLTPFHQEALDALYRVAHGTVVTYSELAAMTGRPTAVRAAGRAMATNPFPLVLPCHRVVGKKGDLTGFGPGLAMKRWLLVLEGVLSA
ncbi:methylated-dna--protein-cysteine methyltransferase [hydrocarbon metagenome]|uniref:methylated-DNA--[protein]-cysteine S-methyltransferase n=1 Tax=hydrocarbon metagenome TaxID=938273 RepID=A0A0W8G698_9ZZZZ